jgi:DNA polymerase-3 subunit delta
MFYVLHGDDAFTRSEELGALGSKMGDPEMAELNTTLLDGRAVSWDELRQHCDSLPFLSERRLVVVTGLLTRLGQRGTGSEEATFLERLLEHLPHLPPTTRLIFLEDRSLPDGHPILELARSQDEGYERVFVVPSGSALTRWVYQRVRQEGGQIDADAAQVLCEYVGNDLYHLHNEIRKLVSYTNAERPISETDVRTLTPKAREAEVFDLVDALGRRNGRRALRIYHDLLSAEEHPLAILGMIARQFRLLIQVKELAPQLPTVSAIARALHQHPYPIRKVLAQSHNYSLEQLRVIYHRLLEVDVDIKTGQTEAMLALDALIAGLGGHA